MVVLDDSKECLNAMRFAAMRAANSGGGVTILSVISPDEFNHWIGVSDIMREEARERIEVHFEVFAKWMRDRKNIEPELVIREGEVVSEIWHKSNPILKLGFWFWVLVWTKRGLAPGHPNVQERGDAANPCDDCAGR